MVLSIFLYRYSNLTYVIWSMCKGMKTASMNLFLSASQQIVIKTDMSLSSFTFALRKWVTIYAFSTIEVI